MITRRGFGFLTSVFPILGKPVVAEAINIKPGVTSTVTGQAFVKAYTKSIHEEELKSAAIANAKRVSRMAELLKKAEKLKGGVYGIDYDKHVHEINRFDPDILSMRSFSLAGAEYMQRQRDRKNSYDEALASLKSEFEKLFGLPLDFANLGTDIYTNVMNSIKTEPWADRYVPEPDGENMPEECESEDATVEWKGY